MKSISFLKIAAVAAFMAVGISVSAQAQAGTGTWNSTASGPTMYQTQWTYYSRVMTPPARVPSTAQVNYIWWADKFSWFPSALTTYLCSTNSAYCYQIGGTSGGYSIPTGYYNASDQFQFAFRDKDPSPAHTYSSSFQSNPIGGGHQLFLGYQY
ncbi:MAG: flagellar protein FlhE [Magnetovibrio sp.]|nr:flagellar protein FlhE [Magnetovibrio sp.]